MDLDCLERRTSLAPRRKRGWMAVATAVAKAAGVAEVGMEEVTVEVVKAEAVMEVVEMER